MKKTLLTILSMVLCMSMQAKVTLDFTNAAEEWGIPQSTSSGTHYYDEASYTNGTYTISLGAPTTSGNGYYYNSGGYLMLCESGAYMKLPVFDFAVGTIVVGGHSGGSSSATMNIFVDDTAVSTECTDTSADHTYAINSNYQTIGTQYVYKNTSSKNLQVTYIDIYEVGEEVDGDGGDGGDGGSGTGHGYEPDDPYSVSEVIALAQTLNSSETVTGVYVKGIVSQISSFYEQYGDMDYYISDDGTTTNQFYIYNGYYLGGEKFTNEDQIQDGDEVVVTGDLTNYQGTTPELARGSKIYSLNGKTSDDGDGGGTTGGTGHGYEADDPFTPSEAVALAETLSSSDTVTGVYVKGIVSQIGSFSADYGDLNYYISDDGSTSNQFYIYNGYYLDGEKFTSADQIKVSDTVLVTGDLINYYGNTPELARGSKILSIEEGDGSTSGNEPDPSLVRTLENSGVTAGSETATIDFTSLGLENETNVDEVVFTLSDGSTVVFGKADGNNAPMYYTNGTAVRVYALNTITFACSQEIAKIEMVCNSSQYLGNDTYTIEWSDTGAVYCNYQEENGEPKNSGGTQLRIQQIIVTYAGEAGEEDGISSVRSDIDGDGVMYNIGGQRVSDSYRGIVIVNGRKILKK